MCHVSTQKDFANLVFQEVFSYQQRVSIREDLKFSNAAIEHPSRQKQETDPQTD